MNDNSNDTGERVRLLLVDDEEAYVNVLANRFARRGIDTTKTYSGTAALQAIRNHEFDVAVLDLKMADMDGIEVLKVFKRMDPAMEVIMLTGHGSAAAARQGMEAGAFDYLMKPCEFASLFQKVRDAAKYRKEKEASGTT